ncbi:MAG: type II toxin-antitoxin system Phd/YefM family antitoxin [Vicinamibacterales bacterium]
MVISVTQFKARCLALLRALERKGETIDIERRGRVVARLLPAAGLASVRARPWERLRGTGRLTATAGESVLNAQDFEASR